MRVHVPSQERPWEVTPGSASLQTLQKVGLACEQAYQLCIPEKCSTLNWLACGSRKQGKSVLCVKPAPLSEMETHGRTKLKSSSEINILGEDSVTEWDHDF